MLHMFTIDDNHLMYGSWDSERDGEKFLSFWTIFCPFTSLTTRKVKILKNWKKCLEILSFYQMCTMNDNYMMYGSWDMERDGQGFFILDPLFYPFTALKTRKIKILKEWKQKTKKTSGDVIILHRCTKNHDHVLHCSWNTMRYECNPYLG